MKGTWFSIGVLLLLTTRASWAGEGTLVLGILAGAEPRPALRTAVQHRLIKMGERVRAAWLSPAELRCKEEACLQALARRYQADRVLGGEVQLLEQDAQVRMFLWDVQRRTLQPGPPLSCEACTVEMRQDTVELAAGRLLEPQEETAPNGSVAGSTVGMDKEVRYFTPGRAAAVGVFGGLLLSTLAAGISMAAGMAGNEYSGETGQRWNLRPQMGLTFAGAGLMLTGLTLSLSLRIPKR